MTKTRASMKTKGRQGETAAASLPTMAMLVAGSLLAALNQTLVSPALPAIMSEFGIAMATVQWVVSGYSLVNAIMVPLCPYLLGKFGIKHIYLTALSAFAVGSFLSFLSPLFPALLVGRALQAVCAGMITPMTMTVLLLSVPRERRGIAMGVVSLIIGFAPAVGPSIAGLVVDHVGWRLLFLAVSIVGVSLVVGAALAFRSSLAFPHIGFDGPSVLLSGAGLALLLYGLSSFTTAANVALPVGAIAVGAVLVVVFVRRQSRTKTPMLQVRVLETFTYRRAVMTIMIIQAALMGVAVLLPVYVQDICGFSATDTGLVMLPGALIGALLSLAAGWLFDRYGIGKVAGPGCLAAVAGAVGMGLLGPASGLAAITCAYSLLAVSEQIALTPLSTWGMNALPNGVIQHAQSLSSTLYQVAGALGTALIVSVSSLAGGSANVGAGASFAGIHAAFMAVLVLMVAAFLLMAFSVRRANALKRSQGR